MLHVHKVSVTSTWGTDTEFPNKVQVKPTRVLKCNVFSSFFYRRGKKSSRISQMKPQLQQPKALPRLLWVATQGIRSIYTLTPHLSRPAFPPHVNPSTIEESSYHIVPIAQQVTTFLNYLKLPSQKESLEEILGGVGATRCRVGTRVWSSFFTQHGCFLLRLIQKKQRCYKEAAISSLHLIFISRAEDNWMSHLLTQFHSANYSIVIFFFLFLPSPLHFE